MLDVNVLICSCDLTVLFSICFFFFFFNFQIAFWYVCVIGLRDLLFVANSRTYSTFVPYTCMHFFKFAVVQNYCSNIVLPLAI